MIPKLRGHLAFIILTAAVCCGAYPLTLFVLAKAVPAAAAGSLIGAGKSATGSRLIAQPFTADEYFWPRPSAAGYNGAVSSGSNWGANNPKLRDRVAQQLGPIVAYKKGSKSAGTAAAPRTPQQDIEAWFAAAPDRAAAWAAGSAVGPANWAKSAPEIGAYILAWAKANPGVAAEWAKANPDSADGPKPEDVVAPFFAGFVTAHPGRWPAVVETKAADGAAVKTVAPAAADAALHANFFDLWLCDPANRDKAADLEPVPVDMVTASGSGLDPHITLRNALSVYQLDRVAAKRAAGPADAETVKAAVAALVRERAFTPLGGAVGEPLVNVLELNIALDAAVPVPAKGP